MDWAWKIAGPPTPYKINVNNCKLIDLVIRIELTRATLTPRFWYFLRKSIINFRMILYLVAYFLRLTVSLICRLQAASNIHVPIYPYLISEGCRNCSTLWQAYSNETVTLRKHVTKYKNMRKWMVEYLKKFENRGIKIVRVYSILITKCINLQLFTLLFCTVSGVRSDVHIFKLSATCLVALK